MPQVFQNMVARATARDRCQRFQKVKELANVLRQLANAPVHRRTETPTILVIEDDDTLRDTLEFNLLSEGYRVVIANNGREGMQLAVEEAPDLVLLDVTLPGLNGFDVCRDLRQKVHRADHHGDRQGRRSRSRRGPGNRR